MKNRKTYYLRFTFIRKMSSSGSFQPYDPESIMCPHCNVPVIRDHSGNHKLIAGDRIDCKIAKTIYRITASEEIRLTDNQILNQIVMVARTVKGLEKPINDLFQRMSTQENNYNNLNKRLIEFQKEIFSLRKIIKDKSA